MKSLPKSKGSVSVFIGDGSYDSPSTYEALKTYKKRSNQNRPMKVIIPPYTGFWQTEETNPLQHLGNIIENKGKLLWQNRMDYDLNPSPDVMPSSALSGLSPLLMVPSVSCVVAPERCTSHNCATANLICQLLFKAGSNLVLK